MNSSNNEYHILRASTPVNESIVNTNDSVDLIYDILNQDYEDDIELSSLPLHFQLDKSTTPIHMSQYGYNTSQVNQTDNVDSSFGHNERNEFLLTSNRNQPAFNNNNVENVENDINVNITQIMDLSTKSRRRTFSESIDLRNSIKPNIINQEGKCKNII